MTFIFLKFHKNIKLSMNCLFYHFCNHHILLLNPTEVLILDTGQRDLSYNIFFIIFFVTIIT